MIIQEFLFKDYLDNGEKIIAVAHKHILLFMGGILRDVFFGMLLPLGIYIMFPQTMTYMILWGLIGLIALLYDFYDWYFDAWLMTNQGVLDIEWKSLFNMTATRIEYHMIEGISYEINGFWPTIFNYGVVTLEKVGSGVLVQLRNVNNPKRVEQALLDCQKACLTRKSFREHGALKNLLTELIMDHVRDHGLPDVIEKRNNGK